MGARGGASRWAMGWVLLAVLAPGRGEAQERSAAVRVERAAAQVEEGPAALGGPAAPLRGAAHLQVQDGQAQGGRALLRRSRAPDAASLRLVLSRPGALLRLELDGHRPSVTLERDGEDSGAPPRAGRVRVRGRGRLFLDGQPVARGVPVEVRASVRAPGGLRPAEGRLEVRVEGLPARRFPGGRLRLVFEEGVLLSFADGVVLTREGVLVAEGGPGAEPGPRSDEGEERQELPDGYGGAGPREAPDATAPDGHPPQGRDERPRVLLRRRAVLGPDPRTPLPPLPGPRPGAGRPRLELGPSTPVDGLPRPALRLPLSGPEPLQGGAPPLQQGPLPLAGGARPLQAAPAPLQGGAPPLQGGAAPLQGGAVPLTGGPRPLQGGARPLTGGPAPLQGAAPPLAGAREPVGSRPVDPLAPGGLQEVDIDVGPALQLDGRPAGVTDPSAPVLALDPGPVLGDAQAATPARELETGPVRPLGAEPALPLDGRPALNIDTGPALPLDGSPALPAQEGPALEPHLGAPGATGAPRSPGVVPLNALPPPAPAAPVTGPVVPLNVVPPPVPAPPPP